MKDIEEIHRIEDIIGSPLSGVCFVIDYVEFHFEGPVIRSFGSVSLIRGSQKATFPDPGSRDAFCSLIGAEVQAVEVSAIDIIVRFVDQRNLLIPLSSHFEAVHFVVARNHIMRVWGARECEGESGSV
jgi:hypothetical protein